MPVSGGNKDFVKMAAFGTRPFAPSDFAHIKDISTQQFAYDLGKSVPGEDMTKKKKKKRKGNDGDDDDEENDDDDDESKMDSAIAAAAAASSSDKKKTTSKVDPDDLARFLESEGGGSPNDLCPIPKCMDVISQIILNDKNSKIEKESILDDIEVMMGLLRDSEKEETKLGDSLEQLNKEQVILEKQVENQNEKAKNIQDKRDDLEKEKKSFNSKLSELEREQRLWVTKLRNAQAILSKVIWRKPGQVYDDEDDGSLKSSIVSITPTKQKDLDEISVPQGLSYEFMADIAVSDYIERPTGPLYFPSYVQDQINYVDNYSSVISNASDINSITKQKNKLKTTINDSTSLSDNSDTKSVFTRQGLSMSGSVRSFLLSTSSKRMISSPSRKSRSSTASLISGNRSAATSPIRRLKPLNNSPSKLLSPQKNTDQVKLIDDQSINSLKSLHTIETMSSLGYGSVTSVSSPSRNSLMPIAGRRTGVAAKAVGKIRVNQSGVGKINRKNKTIAELLAEEEEAN